MLHEDMRLVLQRLSARRPPDGDSQLGRRGAVDVLSGFARSARSASRSNRRSIRLMAKLPTIAAYAYKKSIGQPFVYPRNDLTYCENFLQMMFAVPSEPYEVDPDFVEALEPAADRPCRSRAELQHVDRADGRLVRREPVRLDLGRHLRLVGAAARRGQRGLRRNARSRFAPTAAT